MEETQVIQQIRRNPFTREFKFGNITICKTQFINAVFKENCISDFNYEAFLYPAVTDETVLLNVKQKPCLPYNLIEIESSKKLLAYYNEVERIHLCGVKENENLDLSDEKSSNSNSSPSPKSKLHRIEANVALDNKTYYFNGTEAVDVDLYNGELDYFDDDKEDVVTYHFRGLAKLKKGHSKKTKEVLFNCVENKTLFLSFNSGNKYGIDELQTIVKAFEKWMKRTFVDNLKYAVVVYEPSRDGSWHFHSLPCFEDVPENFETCFASWANNYNNKQGIIEQTDVQLLESKDDILRVWEYLNPASEKKRERAVYYPQNFHNIVSFGNRTTPPSIKVTGETLLELLDATEAVEMSAEQVVVIDNDTGEVNEFADYWFKLDKGKLDKLVSQTIMDAIMCDDDDILTFSFAPEDVGRRGLRGTPLTRETIGTDVGCDWSNSLYRHGFFNGMAHSNYVSETTFTS